MKEMEYWINGNYYKEKEKNITIFQKSFENEIDIPCFFYSENLIVEMIGLGLNRMKNRFTSKKNMVGEFSLDLIYCWMFFMLSYRSLRSYFLWKQRVGVVVKLVNLIVSMLLKKVEWKNKIISQKRYYTINIENNILEELNIDWKKWSILGFWTDDLILVLKIAKKIKKQMSKKVVIRRHYSEQVVNFDDDLDIYKIFNGHIHQNMIYGEGISEVNKLVFESVFSLDVNGNKVDWTKDLTEELNKNALEVKKNLSELEKEGKITEKQKEKIWGNGKLGFEEIKIEKGQKVKIGVIKNFTTSSKNAINIIEKGKLKDYPVNKGINLHNNSLVFWLMGNEDYKRLMWYLIIAYNIDKKNQKYLKQVLTEKKLNSIEDECLKEMFENINNLKSKEFKPSKEFNSDGDTMFGYLLNEIKEK